MKHLFIILIILMLSTTTYADDTINKQCELLSEHAYQMVIGYYDVYPDYDEYLNNKVPMLVNMLAEKFEAIGEKDKLVGNKEFSNFNKLLIEGAMETMYPCITAEEAEASAMRVKELTMESCLCDN